MRLNIPLGSKINSTRIKNEIRIRIPQTTFWILGYKKENKLWDAYLYDPETKQKIIIKENATTESFARFSSIILKTPFPFEGKRAENLKIIIKFIKNTTKIKNVQRNNKRSKRS